MNQLALGTLSGRTQPTIEFSTWNQKNNSRRNAQKYLQKQIASNQNRNENSGILNNRVQNNPIG